MGSLGLLACGGGSNSNKPDSGIIIGGGDGGTGGDGGSTAACDPTKQSGCTGTDKCTYIYEDSSHMTGHTDCAPNGDVAVGQSCTIDDTTGVDNCAAGTFCSGGVCTEICTLAPADSCGTGEACVPYHYPFSDLTTVGLCNPTCDVLNPSDVCGADVGCYASVTSGDAICAPPVLDSDSSMGDGADCTNNPGTQDCWCSGLNGCAIGFGCLLEDDLQAPTKGECGQYCDATGANSAAVCSNLQYTCRQANMLFKGYEAFPDSLGVCVSPTIFGGYCFGCPDFEMTKDGCNPDKCCDTDPNTTPAGCCDLDPATNMADSTCPM